MMTAKEMNELRRFRPLKGVAFSDDRPIPRGWSIVAILPLGSERVMHLKRYPVYWSGWE